MIMKLVSLAILLVGLVPTSMVAAASTTTIRRGATAAVVGDNKSSTSTTALRNLQTGSGESPADCATDEAVIMNAIASGANAVLYLCDGFYIYPTTSLGTINDKQKVRIVCMGTCTIDGSSETSALPREVFQVRTGGVLQMYGVDVVNLPNSRVVDANGVGCVVAYASCKLQNNGFTSVTGQLGGTTEVENGATGLALGSKFDGNFAFSGGGAIRVLGADSTLVLKKSDFVVNSATRSGGALHIQNGISATSNPIKVYIDRCSFDSNGSGRSGGAIWSNRNADIKIHDCSFNFNEALAGQGGAFFIGGDSVYDSEGNSFDSNAGNSGNHIFINDANNYFNCNFDTLQNPNFDDPSAVVTPDGPFFCSAPRTCTTTVETNFCFALGNQCGTAADEVSPCRCYPPADAIEDDICLEEPDSLCPANSGPCTSSSECLEGERCLLQDGCCYDGLPGVCVTPCAVTLP